MEYVYLIREREFIRLGENVIKIGKSVQLNCIRKNQYPKFSELYGIVTVKNCQQVENKLKREFKVNFRQMEYGYEYFEGDIKAMVKLFLEIAHDDYMHCEVRSSPEEVPERSDVIGDVDKIDSILHVWKWLSMKIVKTDEKYASLRLNELYDVFQRSNIWKCLKKTERRIWTRGYFIDKISTNDDYVQSYKRTIGRKWGEYHGQRQVRNILIGFRLMN